MIRLPLRTTKSSVGAIPVEGGLESDGMASESRIGVRVTAPRASGVAVPLHVGAETSSGSTTLLQQPGQMPWLNRADEWAVMYVSTRCQ